MHIDVKTLKKIRLSWQCGTFSKIVHLVFMWYVIIFILIKSQVMAEMVHD